MAAQYASLVGKYVRMERRPIYEDELAEAADWYGNMGEVPADYKIGGEGTVAYVYDDGRGVAVVFDYGMGYIVNPETEKDWALTVFQSEDAAKSYKRPWRPV